MKSDDGALKNDPSKIDGESDRVESRRRLLKAGLIAVPFLVTLHALPARAGRGQGQGSLGTYGYGDERDRGGGRGHGGGSGGHRSDQDSGKKH